MDFQRPQRMEEILEGLHHFPGIFQKPNNQGKGECNMAHFLFNYDACKVVGKYEKKVDADQAGQKASFKYVVISSKTDLENFPLKVSTQFLTENGAPAAKTKAEAGAAAWEIIKKMDLKAITSEEAAASASNKKKKTPATPGEKKERKPREGSKIDLLKKAFATKKCHTVEELCAITGYDARNLYTSVALLKNPSRTKPENIFEVSYDSKTKSYYQGETNKPKAPAA